MSHAIRRSNNEGLNGENFIKNELIPFLKNGASYMNLPKNQNKIKPKKLFVETNDKKGLVSLDWQREKQCWLLSGYFKTDKKKR